MKLNRASLADKAGWAAAHVERPQYDVAAVAEATKKAPTWVHFGTGNIFRAYLAALAQRMLNEGLTDKGLLMANTNDPAIPTPPPAGRSSAASPRASRPTAPMRRP